jgi:hypothetical protein
MAIINFTSPAPDEQWRQHQQRGARSECAFAQPVESGEGEVQNESEQNRRKRQQVGNTSLTQVRGARDGEHECQDQVDDQAWLSHGR